MYGLLFNWEACQRLTVPVVEAGKNAQYALPLLGVDMGCSVTLLCLNVFLGRELGKLWISLSRCVEVRNSYTRCRDLTNSFKAEICKRWLLLEI